MSVDRDRSPLPTATLRAARVWLRGVKRLGHVHILGGGWWRIAGIDQPVQGYFDLARVLLNAGVIDKTGAFTGKALRSNGTAP